MPGFAMLHSFMFQRISNPFFFFFNWKDLKSQQYISRPADLHTICIGSNGERKLLFLMQTSDLWILLDCKSMDGMKNDENNELP